MTADNHCKNPNLVHKSFIIGVNICNTHSLQQLFETDTELISSHIFENNHTEPGQKISEGHHACVGGGGTCEGSKEANEADGEGTAVATEAIDSVVD